MPITRRTFLRTLAGTASALTTACTPLHSVGAPAFLADAPLTVWSSTYAIDTAIARWRGTNPRTRVTRHVYTPAVLLERLTAVAQEGGNGPDVVISDADTIGMLHATPLWRLFEAPFAAGTVVPAAVAQCRDERGQLYAVPLTVNPLAVWYDTQILAHSVDDATPAALSAVFGASIASMIAQLGIIARTVPDAPILSSVVDDYLLPAVLDARMSGAPFDEVQLISSGRTALATHLAAADAQYSGGWYVHLTQQRSAVVVGGRWMQQALERAVGIPESTWRLTSLNGRALAGPCLVAAVPALAAQSVQASAFAITLATDLELQARLAAASQTVPVFRAAHQNAPFVGSEKFCGGQAIGALWCQWADALPEQVTTAAQRQSDAALRQSIRAAFA